MITVGLNISDVLDTAFKSLIQQNFAFIGIFLLSLLFSYILWQQVKAADKAENDLLETEGQLRLLASIDPLTACFNRRSFLKKANVKKSRFICSVKPFSLIMLDLDKFKDVNDTYGHLVRDEILTQFSQLCHNSFTHH